VGLYERKREQREKRREIKIFPELIIVFLCACNCRVVFVWGISERVWPNYLFSSSISHFSCTFKQLSTWVMTPYCFALFKKNRGCVCVCMSVCVCVLCVNVGECECMCVHV